MCILFKPRFSKKAVLYYGEIKFGDNGYSRHVVKNVHCVYLRYYNGIQFRLAPNMKPVSHSFDSVLKVTPVGQGGFKVQSKIWYKGGLNPIAGQNVNWRSLPSVMGFIESNPRRKMVIQELKPRAEALSELTPPSLPLNNCKTYYISAEDNDVVKNGANQPVRINKGIIFAYVNAQ